MHLHSFQFQNGAIISSALCFLRARSSVSIPKWCDYKFRIRTQYDRVYTVSIPKWCDYKIYNKTTHNVTTKFQFQNGAIIRVSSGGVSPNITLFQFQNGAIISKIPTGRLEYGLIVSIPKWCDYKPP